LTAGVKAGIALDTLSELIPKSAAASWVADHDLPNILAGDDDETFTLALCDKDLRLIADLLRELDVPLSLFDRVHDRFSTALERFGPAAGELAVIRLAEERAGASVRHTSERRDR
jgi:3-hydroxyisobutyrate dehydrogenase